MLDKENTMDKLQELEEINQLFDMLWPLNRSIMGEGYRESLKLLQKYIPFEIEKFNSGRQVFNWKVPKEWVIKEAFIEDESGKKVVDFKENNLSVVNYSIPIDQEMELEELKKHIYTLPKLPKAIPYVTSYYEPKWGFCMRHEQYEKLKPGKYRVCIDSKFIEGTLEVGDAVLEGESDKEFLLTAYLCHPSMANNELSGPIVQAMLYNRIKKWSHRNLNYRFVINPETIGSIAYLSSKGKYLTKNMYGGLVLTCLGGNKELTYKATRDENTLLDKTMFHLNRYEHKIEIRRFTPLNGSDERQYCSPGFNLPMGQMARMVYGEYPEYHTSLDNKELMGIDKLQETVDTLEDALKIIDVNGYYINTHPYGEVKLSDYELYPKLNTPNTWKKDGIDKRVFMYFILMILNYADGEHTFLEIADKIGWHMKHLIPAINVLIEKKLLVGPYYEKHPIR